MASTRKILWSLVRSQPEIDPNDLALAVQNEAKQEGLDYRTRLLIRDSVDALREYWVGNEVEQWLTGCLHHDAIARICQSEFEEVGFPSIKKRLMEKTEPASIQQYLRSLGYELRDAIRINVAGGCALILPGFVSRFTEDIEIVGEVPEIIRTKHHLLDELEKLHGLHMSHVQEQSFPRGWQDRVHSFAVYNHLQVSLVDVYDVFLSKLFSNRAKDIGDLTTLLPQLDRDVIVGRFRDTCQDFLTAPRLKEMAVKNWYVLTGEDLPS